MVCVSNQVGSDVLAEREQSGSEHFERGHGRYAILRALCDVGPRVRFFQLFERRGAQKALPTPIRMSQELLRGAVRLAQNFGPIGEQSAHPLVRIGGNVLVEFAGASELNQIE